MLLSGIVLLNVALISQAEPLKVDKIQDHGDPMLNRVAALPENQPTILSLLVQFEAIIAETPVIYKGKPRDAQWLAVAYTGLGERTYKVGQDRWTTSWIVSPNRGDYVIYAQRSTNGQSPEDRRAAILARRQRIDTTQSSERMSDQDRLFSSKGVERYDGRFDIPDHTRTGEITQIIDESSFLMKTRGGTSIHVSGYDTGSMFDDMVVSVCPIVYNGQYEYITVMGAKRTIRSFRLIDHVTPREFTEALNGGLELAYWELDKERCPVCAGRGKCAISKTTSEVHQGPISKTARGKAQTFDRCGTCNGSGVFDVYVRREIE